MKEYETVFIAKPELTDSQIEKLNDRIRALVEKHEGRLFYARNMGKRRLAYPIAKQIKGVYFCLDYAAKPQVITELERSFRLSEDVIRYLTVVKSEEVDIEARAQEIAARGEDAPMVEPEEVEKPEEVKVESEPETELEPTPAPEPETKTETEAETESETEKKEEE
jgi:small subunit ribosomal protein S6